MSEPIYLKRADGKPAVIVTSQSQARQLEAGGFVRCEPQEDAMPFGQYVTGVSGSTANIRSEEAQPPASNEGPMATGEEAPQPPAPTFPEELTPGEYTNPPSKPKAKGPAKK